VTPTDLALKIFKKITNNYEINKQKLRFIHGLEFGGNVTAGQHVCAFLNAYFGNCGMINVGQKGNT
jgi:hypothetical protein